MRNVMFMLALLFVVGLTTLSPAHVSAADVAAANSAIEMVHLNAATAQQLQGLPGIGPALSERIISYRDQNGPFRTIDQLTQVKGIGEAKLAKFRARLTID